MTTLCFIDTETTGLDPRIHEPYEVCIWREDWELPITLELPHTLEFADGAALKIGDPMVRDTKIGPMARENLHTGLHEQVERSLAEGAVLKLGGAPVEGDGFYYPPTVLDHVRPGMTAFREETFGPVAAIIRAKDADEAVAMANDSEYGLGAALWTGDTARGRALAARTDAGAVFVNGMTASDPRYPFGGIKRSGYGRELGVYGIREFVNVKTVWIGPAK